MWPAVAPPSHPRQRLPSLDSGKGSKQTFTKFLPLFLQKESGFQGSALRTQKEKRCLHTFSTDERFQKAAGCGHLPDSAG